MARKKKSASSKSQPIESVPEDEIWRLAKASQILRDAPEGSTLLEKRGLDDGTLTPNGDPTEEDSAFAEYVFDSILLVIPMCGLFLMMSILVKIQYSQEWTIWKELFNTVTVSPVITLGVFYSNKHKTSRPAQALMFLAAIAAGMRLIWIVNKSGFVPVIKQSPPLATIWVYLIVQLNLGSAVVSLAIVGIWLRYTGLKILF